MTFLEKHPRTAKTLSAIETFFVHPFKTVWSGADWDQPEGGTGGLRGLGRWLWTGVKSASLYIWDGIKRKRVVVIAWIGVLVILFIVAAVLFDGAMIYVENKMVPVPAPDRVVYQDQGWGAAANSDTRLLYYYTPQGAFVKNVRYDWMANLERPWKTERFAEPKYMRSYGFIIDQAELEANPGQLPVGFAPRYDETYGEMMLDLTCAGCHTGELQIVKDGLRTAFRVDGGSAHHDFTTVKPGRFALDLLSSLVATRWNPFKFARFAESVLKDSDTGVNRSLLKDKLGTVISDILKQAAVEGWKGVYPMEEGFGRTDGLGRILNTAFAVNLTHANYRVADAPVSYPFIWEIPWYDWVQYTASVRQPMARNAGEAMGTGARYYLLNPYGQPLPAAQRYEASVKVANLERIEHALRELRPPCWPEDLFGKIDKCKAAEGKKLFYEKYHCVSCHGPHVAPDFVTARDAPYKLAAKNPRLQEIQGYQVKLRPNYPHWTISALPIQEIGTDPTSALNFFRYRVDLTPTGIKAEEMREELKYYYETDYCRQYEYYINLVTLLTPGGENHLNPPMSILNPGYQAPPLNPREIFVMGDACNLKVRRAPVCPNLGPAIKLEALTEDQKNYLGWPAPTKDSACANLGHLLEEGKAGYLQEKIGNIELSDVSMGTGLNYLLVLVRKRAYRELGIEGDDTEDKIERNVRDGFAQLDIPVVEAQYESRPLAGVWATPPFLHNGSVPSLYEMLLPAYRRSKQFYRRIPNFDPRAVGLYTDASDKNAFLFDTTIRGNYNSGHEFRAGYRPWVPGDPPSYGVIGPEMTDPERWAIIEYLKVLRDYDDGSSCPEKNYAPTAEDKCPVDKPAVAEVKK